MKIEMEKKINRPVMQKTMFAMIAFLLLSSYSVYAQKVNFLSSPIVPAAEGYVKINRDKNKNYVIKVNTYNMAYPGRLVSAKLTYVIWLVTEEGVAKYIGQIKSGKAFMSKSMRASFQTVSTFKPTKIFLTTEDDPSTQYPSAQVVILTDTF